MLSLANLNSIGSLPSASSSSFTPAALPSLTLWLDATRGTYTDAGSTLTTTNNAAIQQWNDQSGSGNHQSQATLAKRPKLITASGINSKSALRFDGVDDFMSGALTATVARTIFVVVKGTTATANVSRFFAVGNVFGSVLDSNGVFHYYATEANAETNLAGVTTVPNIVTLSYADTSHLTAYINNVAATTFDPNDAYSNINTLYLAADDGVGSDQKDCDIAEVLNYSRTLSTAERNQVQAYLAAKYSITLS